MRRQSFIISATVLALTACAHSPQAAPRPATPTPAAPAPTPSVTPAAAVDPVGVYDFSAMNEGQEVTGTITITGSAGSYGGTVTASGMSDATIRSVTVRGSTITVTADTSDGEAVLEFTLTGQDLSGRWSLGGMSGTLTGQKRNG